MFFLRRSQLKSCLEFKLKNTNNSEFGATVTMLYQTRCRSLGGWVIQEGERGGERKREREREIDS